ncbi:hypothetical protein GIB67_009429 [Kingdonia uniflora]|uniref:Morc S5 domain-containing protein n=1 Tax=Kingdonia uniflora TaxID=39325 RepID=A0A7J7N3E2_9MAGN|nr:hypothetical protein GIB67_009429 [Kingdonia uniflora]
MLNFLIQLRFLTFAGGMDHVRVHPRFLHSNATSHKWALGAFAELLDNSLDEVCHGATFANIDMIQNKKDGNKMLLVEDNGGGMDPDKMRHCMSLGYSAKSKMANTIGQYGNGFKTSSMRLGADVIVFSRCSGKDGKSPTQSIGMLSYTFLRGTGKEDIVVPMLDYEKGGRDWNRMMRSSPCDWNRNLETIVKWSPYCSETDLIDQVKVFSVVTLAIDLTGCYPLCSDYNPIYPIICFDCQFSSMKDHGTRVIIYNLWEDDAGELELDFDTDQHDIQIRGVNRDESKIEMARKYRNSRHFLTYRHSLRSYASILYLRLPVEFRIVLRGKEVEHHNIVNDMMLTQDKQYRPQSGPDSVLKDTNMSIVVTIGFVKDAKHHIDVQGFNVYHKNRLIKPFWRVWNSAGSDGRGVIGVLEANFVEPAHDKQGFERTIVLSRLEARLKEFQKLYWTTKCDEIGYAARIKKKPVNESGTSDSSPDYHPPSSSSGQQRKLTSPNKEKNSTKMRDPKHGKGYMKVNEEIGKQSSAKFANNSNYLEPTSPSDISDNEIQTVPSKRQYVNTSSHNTSLVHFDQLTLENQDLKDRMKKMEEALQLERKKCKLLNDKVLELYPPNPEALSQITVENHETKLRLNTMEEGYSQDLQLESEKCRALEAQLKESELKLEEMNKEQEAFLDLYSQEKSRHDLEEEKLKNKLKVASDTIEELLEKVRQLEKMKPYPTLCKTER